MGICYIPRNVTHPGDDALEEIEGKWFADISRIVMSPHSILITFFK